MKTRKPSDKESEEKMPFSFKKTHIPSKKIDEHWQRIENQIAEQSKKDAAEGAAGAEGTPDGPKA
jgi:hypothetical protein